MAGNSGAVQVRIASSGPGQRGHDLRLGAQPGYVVSGSSELNRILQTPLQHGELRAICVDRRARRPSRRAMRSDATVAIAGIITFGHRAQALFEALDAERQDAAYREVAEAVARRLDTSVSGLVVHRDESAPHAHFQLVGVTHRGYPVSRVAKIGALRDLQTIAAEVMGRHAPGIERGTPKALRLAAGEDYADVVHRSVKELHADLPAERAALRAEIEAERAALGEAEAKRRKNEDLAARARRKAEGEGARAQKAARNAETYERRAEAARGEIERLEGRLGELEAREEAVAAREAELATREARLAKEAELTARAMGNLRAAVGQAMSGRHLEEVTAADMADQPERFATLRKAAPDGRPTWGFRAAFWSHHFGDTGDPLPLPQAVREASEKAFAKVAAFARERLGLLETIRAQARAEAAQEIEVARLTARDEGLREAEAGAARVVRAAESAAEGHLASARLRQTRSRKGPQRPVWRP